ncbi:MAG: hypothetical protein HOP21_07830 [Methylotenera sp.]|nr:hypothetical protein [Methylotenera sp.]
MKPIKTIKHDQFKLNQHIDEEDTKKVISRAFRLDFSPNNKCFILIATNQAKIERCGVFDIFFIKDGRIFEYECLNPSFFEEKILDVLVYEQANKSQLFLMDNGFGRISERNSSLNRRLENIGLDSIISDVEALLDYRVIGILKVLGLDIIPRIYNWLTEVEGKQASYRIQALLQMPIILVPIVALSDLELISTILDPHELEFFKSSQFEEINRRVDEGQAIQEILRTVLNISQESCLALEGQKFWNVNSDDHPDLHQQFKEYVDVYEYLSLD